jgi:hypothetical protein
MLSAVRTVALARVAAVAVAVALSGAPRLAEAHARPVHRCACPAHAIQRDCSCGTCHTNAPGAKGAGCAKHGGGHRQACPGAARVVGSCGMPEAPAAPPSGVDAFTLPRAVALVVAVRAEPLPPTRGAPLPRARDPETPPPKRAA